MCLVYIKIQSTTHNYSMVSHSSRKFDSSRQSFYCHFSVHYLPCVCVMCVIIVWSWSCAFVHILTRFWNKIVKISAAIKIQIKSMHTHRVERTITLYKQSNSNGNHPNRQNSQLTLVKSFLFFHHCWKQFIIESLFLNLGTTLSMCINDRFQVQQ